MSQGQPGWRRYANAVIAQEVSSLTQYYDGLIQHGPLPEDDGLLLSLIQCAEKHVAKGSGDLPSLVEEHDRRSAILLNGTLNHSHDIEAVLAAIRPKLSSTSRVIAVIYNPYLGWIYRLATRLGIRRGEAPTTFVTSTDLLNLSRLAGFRVVRTRSAVYCPFRLAGIGSVINAVLPAVPILRHLSFTAICVLAPVSQQLRRRSLSVVIPARNERGNIQSALDGLTKARDDLAPLEVIFVEGHSTDGTWEEIERLAPRYEAHFRIRAFRQEGKGKGDAVRLGFAYATGDLLTILDADLTVPPIMLTRFVNAYHQGYGDFINGSRLVYAQEQNAMRFLNRLGNILFAKALSRVLSVRLGDSLCGTKLMARHDYTRFVNWRKDFGDFDPFGDFELLFPAAVLGLTVVDVPVRYGARSYGTTSISRFRHGFMLLQMTVIGFFKVRLGRVV